MQVPQRFQTLNFEFISYICLTEIESKSIWIGRNHPEIRKWMTNSTPFSYKEHLSFIESLRDSKEKQFWAIKYNNQIIGAYILNPYNTLFKYGESGKFIFPSFQGLGLGSLVTAEFLDYMFKNNILNIVFAKTRIDNIRNQKINKILGFEIIEQDLNYIYMSLTKTDYFKK